MGFSTGLVGHRLVINWWYFVFNFLVFFCLNGIFYWFGGFLPRFLVVCWFCMDFFYWFGGFV